jgi:hypothetical protein
MLSGKFAGWQPNQLCPGVQYHFSGCLLLDKSERHSVSHFRIDTNRAYSAEGFSSTMHLFLDYVQLLYVTLPHPRML